jgi:hypothetical protein
MKKLLNIIMITLGVNFLLMVGGIGYLFKTGALTKEKIATIKVLLGPATTQAAVEVKKDLAAASTQPTVKLEELLAKVSGRPAGEQVEFMQRTFDAQMAQLDRREREVGARQQLVQRDKEVQDKRQALLDTRQATLDEREKTLTNTALDKGFTDTLALYDSMTARQVKDAFAGLDDAAATKYLRAMEPSRAAKILKEFKSPTETTRVQKFIDMIRAPQADIKGVPQ